MAIRKKRSDTQVGNVEKKNGVDFCVRSDKQLGNYLKDNGFASMSRAIKAARSASVKK